MHLLFGGDIIPGTMRNILIAENNESFRSLLSRVLSAEGHEVIEVDNSTQALEAARNHNNRIDLLCTNAAGSPISGVVLAERLKSQNPDLKVILLVTTGHHFIEMETRAVAEKHPDYEMLTKPFSIDQFCTSVRKLLNQRPVQAAGG